MSPPTMPTSSFSGRGAGQARWGLRQTGPRPLELSPAARPQASSGQKELAQDRWTVTRPPREGRAGLESELTWGPSNGIPQQKEGQEWQLQHLWGEGVLGLRPWAQGWRGQAARRPGRGRALPCQDSRALLWGPPEPLYPSPTGSGRAALAALCRGGEGSSGSVGPVVAAHAGATPPSPDESEAPVHSPPHALPHRTAGLFLTGAPGASTPHPGGLFPLLKSKPCLTFPVGDQGGNS